MAVSSKVTGSLAQRLWNGLAAWTVKTSGYQKLGLRREDLYMEEDADIKEAIRRLPEKEQNLRLFRIKRALDLSLKHSVLPRDQWTKPEEDILYLRPYVQTVQKEMREREVWDKQ